MRGENGAPASGARRIFLSVAGPDEGWGSWLDHVLREAGYEVDFYHRSFPLGANFIDQIDAALTRADRMIAVISPSYLDRSSWVREEWQAGMRIAHDRDGFLLPVLVEACELPPLLSTINMIVLVGLDRAAAVQTMLRGLREPPAGPPEPGHEPPFPGYGLLPAPPRLAIPAAGTAAPAEATVPVPPRQAAGPAAAGEAAAPGPAPPRAELPQPWPPRPGLLPEVTDSVAASPGLRHPPASARASARPAAGPAVEPPARPAGQPPAPAAERTSITVLHLPTLTAPARPGHTPDPGPDPFDAPLLDDLGALAVNPGITPDLLVVTGLVLEGRRGEYEQASARLAGLAERLGLPVHRIALVPGRGDVSAAAARAYFAACEDEEIEPTPPYWRKWRHFVDFHANFYRGLDDRTFAVGQEWTLYPMPDLRLVVAGLNSTMAMSHRQADDRGEVGQAQARWFADRLAAYERAGWFRLAIGHHPPLAADRIHSAKATDAYGVDVILGGHVNLVLAAHGHGAPTAGAPLPAVPSRLPRSGTSLISTHPPHPVPTAQAAHRYQLLRISRTQVTRLDRRFARRAGVWRAADETGPAGTVSYRSRWEHAEATFPRPARRQPAGGFTANGSGERPGAVEPGKGSPTEDGRASRRGESFADRVAEIAEISSPGATVTRISPVSLAPEYLRVTVPHGPVFEQRPVGIAEDGVDEGAVDRFVEHVHRQYAATDPQLTSDLVYGGPLPAPDGLVRHAAARGVRLRSFVEYQGLLDLRSYLRRQGERLAADRLYPPALYLPQRYRLIDGVAGPAGPADGPAGEKGGDLLGQLVDWLTADSARFVLILGDFGRGKTFCLHELARTLPELRPHLIPLLIDLRTMEKAHSVDELVAAHLVASGEQRVDVSVFRYMLRRGRLVLLFDGFDELALRVTYETAAEHLGRLLDAVEGQAKIVVTSRTQHFLSHGQVRGALGARVELLPASRIAEVGDFTERQIEEFLIRLHHGDVARARERLGLIHDIRDLLGLSHNPRMLGFIASLDTDRLRAVQARTGVISSADLYGELIEEWLRYEEARARPPGAGPTLTAGERREAVTALALRLWRTTDQVINLSELATTTSAALDAMTDRAEAGQLDSDQAAHMVGSGSLLVRGQEGGFTFIHQSVMEYLVAAAAARGLAEARGHAPDHAASGGAASGGAASGGAASGGAASGGAASGSVALDSADVLAARAMSPLMVDFLRGVAGDGAATAWARRALADPESGQAARVNALAIARRADPAAARGAHLAGAHLEGAELAGLDLTGADLTGANLTDATLDDAILAGATLTGARLTGVTARGLRLTGADLTDATLNRACLSDADLTGATLTGSRWERAALLGAIPPDLPHRVPELAAAAVPGRDPVEVVVDSGSRWTHAVSPSHDLVAYATGHHVALADLSEGQVLAVLRGPGEWIRALAFSADGATLAAGDVAGQIQLWNVTTAEEIASFTGHTSRIRSLAFSPDGRLLASGCWSGRTHLWDLATLARVATPHDSPDRVKALAFSPDGTMLAYGSEVRLWDVGTSQEISVLGSPDENARTLRFSPDGTRLAWIGGESTTRIWDLAAGREMACLRGDEHKARALAIDRTGTLIAVGADDGTVRVWDLSGGGPPTTLRAAGGWVTVLEFVGTDGETLLVGTAEGTIQLWNVGDGAPAGRTLLASRTTDVTAAAFVPETRLVAAVGENGSLRLWDTTTAAQVRVGSGEHATSYGMSLTDDATLLATTGEDGLVRIYELPGRGGEGQADLDTPVRRLNTRRSPSRAVAFSPDTTILAVGHSDGTVGLWDPWTGRPTATLKAGGLRVLSVAFSPDGERLAAGTDAGTVYVWDAAAARGPSSRSPAWTAARRLAGHPDWVNAVVFSPDSEVLASASGPGTIRIWDAASGALRRRLTGRGGRVRTIAFAPDGRLLASGGEDGVIRLWDPENGAEQARLVGHTEEIRSVAFATAASAENVMAASAGDVTAASAENVMAGTLLVSGSDDGTTRLWDVADGGRQLATLVGMSDGHWMTLFPDGSYKTSDEHGAEAGRPVWWSIRLYRFDPEELTPYLPEIRRRPVDAPIPPAGLTPPRR